MHAELNKVLADQAVIAQFDSKGAATMPMDLKAFQKIVDQDLEQWGKAVRDSGAKID